MKKTFRANGRVPWLNQIFKKVKLTILFLAITMVSVSASNSYAQNTELTLNARDISIENLLCEIENQTEFRFFYNENVNLDKMVSVFFQNKNLAQVLDEILKDSNIKYKIIDRLVALYINEQGGFSMLSKQELIIKGKVTDHSGLPLPGANVTEGGTTNGAITNLDGEYTISVSSPNAVLSFSFVGYLTEEIEVTGQTSIDVVLIEDIQTLEEVVVIGYGTSRKKDLTGAIASIKLEDSPIITLPNINLLDALKGSMPGFDIGAVNNAGGNPSINIRGQNSINASNTPLIVVDGIVFVGSMNEINPLDIASVDVLKDASATAVYGSLAANGVILITTKRGEGDKPTVQVNTTTGVQTYTNRPDMLDPEEYLELKKARFLADNPGSVYDPSQYLALYELDAIEDNQTIDWFDEVTRLAVFQNYALSISGASPRSNYYFSGNYMDQEGIVVGDQFHKFSVLGKIESQITDWLKLGVNLNIISKNADGVAADLRLGTIDGPYSYMYVHDRGDDNPGFEDFTYRLERYPQGQSTTSNPLWQTQKFDEDRDQNYRGATFARVDVPWIDGLSYTFNYSLNRWEGHSASFMDENMYVNTMLLNELIDASSHLVEANGSKTNEGRTDWYMNHLINYKQNFGEHSFDVTLLAERQEREGYSMTMSASDFSAIGTSVLGVDALELGNTANYSINTSYSKLSQLAYLARLNYVFKGKYLLSTSIRRDGYSGYAEGHKYGFFRAGSIAWTLSEEDFIRDRLSSLDHLKFRLSFGENGNPSVGAYSTYPTMSNSAYILLGDESVVGVYANKLANKSLDWEKTTALNFGLDFSFFNSKLSGSFDMYNSNTTDLLLSRSIPIFNGFSSVLDNIGEVNNKGVEVQVNTINYSGSNFSWRSGVNFWINRNEVVSLYGKDTDGDGKEDDDISNSLFIGKSMGANYTYVMDGIVQLDDAEYIAIYGGEPGDIKFKDLNNDGKIDADNDRTIVGYSKPNYTMTFSNTLTYKNFEFYCLFNYIAGGGNDNWYIGNNTYAYLPNALYGGTSANWLDKEYWTPENPSNSVTRINYNNSAFNYYFPKTREFLRLQDVSLSYVLPINLLKKTPISALKVYVSGKNLWTLTSWEGLDPETGTEYASTSGFPVFKIYTLGLNVTF